jgi:hypothetical protein
MPIPAVAVWALGAAGTVAIAKMLTKEWRRVNDALHRREAAPVKDNVLREKLPTLRRDPRTGIYRVDRG